MKMTDEQLDGGSALARARSLRGWVSQTAMALAATEALHGDCLFMIRGKQGAWQGWRQNRLELWTEPAPLRWEIERGGKR